MRSSSHFPTSLLEEIKWGTRLTKTQDIIEGLGEIFEFGSQPRKRSPAARASKLSFLEEVTDEQLKTYSEEQIDIILNQRASV